MDSRSTRLVRCSAGFGLSSFGRRWPEAAGEAGVSLPRVYGARTGSGLRRGVDEDAWSLCVLGDQTRRAGRRLGTAGPGRSGRPAGGPGGRGVRRSRVGARAVRGAEVGGEQVVGDESGCVRRPRRRRGAGRGGSCAGAVCRRRLRRVRRASRSGLSSSAVSSSGTPATGCSSAGGALRSRGALLVGRRGGPPGGARAARSRPGVGQQCAGDTGTCACRVQDREPGQDGEHTTWNPAAVNNSVYGTAAPQRSCADRAARVQDKADPWAALRSGHFS